MVPVLKQPELQRTGQWCWALQQLMGWVETFSNTADVLGAGHWHLDDAFNNPRYEDDVLNAMSLGMQPNRCLPQA